MPPSDPPTQQRQAPAPIGSTPLARSMIRALLADPDLAAEVSRFLTPRLARERDELRQALDAAEAEAERVAASATRVQRAAAYLAAANTRLRAVQLVDWVGCLLAGILLGLIVAGVAGRIGGG
jgi:uncharacterized transporter YbjL